MNGNNPEHTIVIPAVPLGDAASFGRDPKYFH
jgi:hypothetical protein